jgi:hypothetical protein
VNVVLEGGGLELEQALVQYRRLRGLLKPAWVREAVAVADTCAVIARHEEAVDAALTRAKRRVAQDPSALAVEGLLVAVERERTQLRAQLDLVLPAARPSDGFGTRMQALAQAAQEEAWFLLARRRFDTERTALTGVMLSLLTLVPLASWWVGSRGALVPTVIDVAAAADQPLAWLAVALSAGATVLAWLRVSTWRWLGVQLPRPAIGLAAALPALLATEWATGSFGAALVAAAFSATLLSSGTLLVQLFRGSRAALPGLEQVD